MYRLFHRPILIAIFAALMLMAVAPAQEVGQRPAPLPAPSVQQPNTDPMYQQLRNIGLSGEVAAASNLVLKRDAGTFTFRSGTFQFLAPVHGRVTGAVFVGDGSFSLKPPLDVEQKSIAILTKEPAMREEFSQLVLRFTDSTYAEIKKGAGVSSGTDGGSSVLNDIQDALRHRLAYNLTARILMDVLSPEPGGLFVAFIKGKKYSGKLIYYIDPYGVPDMGHPESGPPVIGAAPEEVALMTWDDDNWGTWAAFHYTAEYANGKASGKQRNAPVDIESHKLDTVVEKSGRLRGDATTTFVAQSAGLRAVPFDLFRKLRVESVTAADGQPLSFIQEDKNDDPQFFVILPRPLAHGERYSIRTVYEGKDAVTNEGGGNYFPVARTDWYPNQSFKDYAQYDLTFRVPKGMKMAATGLPVREVKEGSQELSEWRSEVPLAVGGFNFGDMRRKEVTLDKEGYLVQAFANEAQPDFLSGFSGGTLYEVTDEPNPYEPGRQIVSAAAAVGTLTTVSLMDKALAEGQLSVQLFTNYFGNAPYKRVAITQQTACNFGQAWPGVVYLPLCSFLDTTTRRALFSRGMTPQGLHRLNTYFKVVTAHEVAHQWWGHAVGWSSYRDQWMSEGFAHMSGSLFIQMTQKNDKEFIQFWDDLRQQLTDRNPEGYRAIDAAPVTLGIRSIKRKVGFNVYSDLVYPKGAYILHMLRMMMRTPQKGDDAFKTMMKDFVKTYTNQPATTEDFKAMVEKHMTPEMDLDGNRKMDWFFNQYVYGTALPHYVFEQSAVSGSDGKPALSFKVTQSNVDPQFKMIVAVYADFGSGKAGRLGTLALTGNSSQDAQVPMSMFKDKPKRLVLNHYNDVLCTQEAK